MLRKMHLSSRKNTFLQTERLMIRLGYAGKNETLGRIGGIKTARLSTIKSYGTDYAKFLLTLNLIDLLEILKFNVKHKIYFYRISSEIAPHFTNPALIPKKYHDDFTKTAYDIADIAPLFKEIGDFANLHQMRLTFHPDLFVVLSTANPDILTRSCRDLYMHSLFVKYMNLQDTAIILHGGGTYGNKSAAIQRWIANFNKLTSKNAFLRDIVVLENDEFSYSITDVLYIANKTHIPVVFDIFHYYCYNKTIIRKQLDADKSGKNDDEILEQPTVAEIMSAIIKTWPTNRTIKMHISEQKVGASIGSHSDYVETIPKILLDFPKIYHRNLDLMVEAKAKEKAVLKLYKKYHLTPS